MMVMPANTTNELVHLWAGRWPNALGHLYTPARKERVRPWLPYALDNGRYSDFVHNRPFDEQNFIAHVERYAFLGQKPRWIVVPDEVGDDSETFRLWNQWAPRLKEYGVPLAIAVQDGMTVSDVASLKPDVVFVGGSTEWKWLTVASWAAAFPRVHVGRVNSLSKLRLLKNLGVESCDGSGWFRGKQSQIVDLAVFLAECFEGDINQVCTEAKATRLTSNYSVQGAFELH